jgi:hypothetical protein
MIDSDLVESINPTDLALYVEKVAGRPTNTNPGRWKAHVRDDVELLVPLDRSDSGYNIRVEELLHNLTVVLHQPLRALVSSIRAQHDDVIRLVLGTVKHGSIDLEKGTRAASALRTLLLSGARAAEEPRLAFAGRASESVRRFSEGLRLGLSEPGSYILTVSSPLDVGVVDDPSSDLPFPRKSVSTTALACMAAKDLATSSDWRDGDGFQKYQDAGVSANLCAAIAELSQNSETDEFRLQFQWSAVFPAPRIDQVSFNGRDGQELLSAASALRERALDSLEEVSGRVERLSSENPSDGGIATVRASIGGRFLLVDVNLRAAQYDAALRAHLQSSAVRAFGPVTRKGRVRVIESCSTFEPIGDLFNEPWVQ